MKLNQKLIVILLSVLGVFSSCGNEGELAKNPQVEEATYVSFAISMPKGDPVTYAMIQDAKEWRIGSLWMYEFDEKGVLLSDPVDVKGDLKDTSNGTYSYSKKITTADKGVRQYLFVANEPVPANFAKSNTITELYAKLAKNKLMKSSGQVINLGVGGIHLIPMTGQATQGNNNSLISVIGNTNVSVKLQRIVARIDIKNNTPNLLITDFKLMNVNTESFLFPAMDNNGEATYAVPTPTSKASEIKSYAVVPGDFKYKHKVDKAFYLYEGKQESKDKAVAVQVRGKLNGIDVLYNIPFWRNNQGVTVKRNHIYYVELGDGTSLNLSNKINFNISDTPWNGINMNEEYAAIDATYLGNIGEFNFEVFDKIKGEKENVLTLSKKGGIGLKFKFTAQFTNHTKFILSVPGNPNWVMGTDMTGDVLSFHVGQNTTTKERTADVWVHSDADPQTKYHIIIQQKAQ